MNTAFTLIIAFGIIAVFHKLVMWAVTDYDGYGEQSDYTRRIDQMYFEMHSRDQLERAS